MVEKPKRIRFIVRMPTVLSLRGFRFMVYTEDHPPPHVHVWHQDNEAIIEIDDGFVRDRRGFNRRELAIVLRIVAQNREFLFSEWRKFMSSRSIEEIMSSPEFNRQFEEAGIRGKHRLKELSKASSARFDAKSRRLVLEMENGVTLLVPVELIQGLQTNDVKALSDFELVAKGTQIHWNTLDVQFYVESLLHGVFGTARWMSDLKRHLSEIGRKGGSSRSEAKQAASAENGKKGGRPRTRRTA